MKGYIERRAEGILIREYRDVGALFWSLIMPLGQTLACME
jgi:hypothetical protein